MDEIVVMSHNQIFLTSNERISLRKRDTYRKALKIFETRGEKRKKF